MIGGSKFINPAAAAPRKLATRLTASALGRKRPPGAGFASPRLMYRSGEHLPHAGIMAASRPGLKLDVEMVGVAGDQLLEVRDTQEGEISASRRTDIPQTLEPPIASDGTRRARIASVMVGLCIDQFELELRWLNKISDALKADLSEDVIS